MAMEIFTVGRGQEGYPERLMPFADMPSRLFVRGALPADEQKTAAIVGARICTAYGKSQAAFFAQVLAANGVAVISGLACGIDAAAHEGALRGKGKTFAVLGCGVDICYPKSSRRLYEQILEQGGILSTFPPGTEPIKRLFPERNRIVSGLADVILVVEARQKSGTFITVDMALEQGKDVYAVPGRLTDRLSDGCNLLIRQGCGVVLSPEDLIAELVMLKNRENGSDRTKDLQKKRRRQEQDKQISGQMSLELSAEDGILGLLDLEPKSADALYESARQKGMKLTMQELLTELIGLCIEGKARQVSGNWFARAVAYSD